MLILKLLKWISAIASGALSVLMLAYLGLKNESWAIVDSDGRIIIDRTAGICIIVAWAVVGALFLLFDFLYRKFKNKSEDGK